MEERLVAALASHQLEAAVAALTDADLKSFGVSALASSEHARLLLAVLLHSRRLEEARALWVRIPLDTRQNDPELQALWEVLQCLWRRDYPPLWRTVQGFQWSPRVQPLVAALCDKLRAEIIEMLGLSFRQIRLGKVAALCGLAEKEAHAACLAAGWTWSEASGSYTVVR